MRRPAPRAALVLALALAACGASPAGRAPFFAQGAPIPARGPAVTAVERWDDPIIAFMRRWDVPGLTLAAAWDGKLAIARGYGYADVDGRVPMEPGTLLRVGSISKVLTAAAVLRLADQGRLDLEDPVARWVTPPAGADGRLATLTVRQLLSHAGGWDRMRSGDPIARLADAAAALGVPGPVTAPELARYALGLPLDFDPGSHFAYSNVGYVLLGRVIEAVTGDEYAERVRRDVCAPAGIAAMRVGGTRSEERAPGEARYYDHATAPLTTSVFPGDGAVPRPYGWTSLAAVDAAGGWIASAVDLVRLMTAIEGSRGAPLLSAARREDMLARPPLPEWKGSPSWYGLGMEVQPVDGGLLWHHGGSMPGTSAELLRAPGAFTVALLLSTRPADASTDAFQQELVDLAWALASAPGPDSTEDLFAAFP